MWAIIGGSGFEKFENFVTIKEIDRNTPFGLASSGIKRVHLGEQECLFVSRHGEHHELLPTEVNYRANIFALKREGARGILSFSAVGSLQKEYAPGSLVVPTQYIDRTKGLRASSFCGDGIVGHVSLARPTCEPMVGRLKEMSTDFDFKVSTGQTYVCIEGPYFSTMAESNFYRSLNADIIGMTHYPEFALAREAGLAYLPCCFITDYDCWDTSRPHVTLEEVIQVMRDNNARAFAVAQAVLNAGDDFWVGNTAQDEGLRMGLMTPKEAIPAEKRQWVDVLLS